MLGSGVLLARRHLSHDFSGATSQRGLRICAIAYNTTPSSSATPSSHLRAIRRKAIEDERHSLAQASSRSHLETTKASHSLPIPITSTSRSNLRDLLLTRSSSLERHTVKAGIANRRKEQKEPKDTSRQAENAESGDAVLDGLAKGAVLKKWSNVGDDAVEAEVEGGEVEEPQSSDVERGWGRQREEIRTRRAAEQGSSIPDTVVPEEVESKMTARDMEGELFRFLCAAGRRLTERRDFGKLSQD
jgi:hypothetical protein